MVYQTCSCGILISDFWYIDVLAVTISVASAAVGFLCGSSARRERERRGRVVPNPKEQNEHDASDDEDSTADGDLSTVSAGFLQPCKLVRLSGLSLRIHKHRHYLPPRPKVLVVRTDLKMTSGKIAAQCGYVPTSRGTRAVSSPCFPGMYQTCDASLLQGASEKEP